MDPDLLSGIGSLASVVVAIFAAVLTYFAWRTSQNSAKAAASVTEIEKARWHAEMRPEFEVEVEGVTVDDYIAACSIKLVGGSLLPWVDVIATIRPSRRLSPSAPETPGPFCWDAGASSTEYENEWTTKSFRLLHGDDASFTMRAVVGGIAMYDPIRLMLDCTTESGDQWLVPVGTRLVRLQDAEPAWFLDIADDEE